MTMKSILQSLFILSLLLTVLSGSGSLTAQRASVSQVLTLRVDEMNALALNRATIRLVIDRALPGSGDTLSVVITDGVLAWTTNGENKKITISSSRQNSRFQLKVSAFNITSDETVAADEAPVSNTGNYDLLFKVGRSSGRCSLRIKASAELAASVGVESHTLTYTITGN